MSPQGLAIVDGRDAILYKEYMKLKRLFPILAALILPSSVLAGAGSQAGFEHSIQVVSDKISVSLITSAQSRILVQQEEQSLLALLSDRDPEVRRTAVRAFKNYVARRSDYRDRVSDMVRSSSEVDAVKHEAIKTLSVVSNYNEVHDLLLDVMRRGTSTSLRVIAAKALYHQAAARSDVRDRILDAARRGQEPEVRLAALWALFLASGNTSVRDPLLDIARRDNDLEARVEALKSLYGAMGYSEVRDLVMRLAQDVSTPASLRLTAILSLSARTNSEGTRLLESIARRDHDDAARRAAIVALGDPRSSEIIRHFHLFQRDINGLPIGDPLDYE